MSEEEGVGPYRFAKNFRNQGKDEFFKEE